jgi:hypothetical protein
MRSGSTSGSHGGGRCGLPAARPPRGNARRRTPAPAVKDHGARRCESTGGTVGSRRPSDWYEDEWEEAERPRRRSSPPPRARTFGLPVVAAALVGGLFVGYVVSSGGGGTTTVTETATVTAPAPEPVAAGVAPSAEATRATIALAVLNGSGESGLAASTGAEARTLGYEDVTEGNAPSPVAADLVLHRQGAAPRAARVAEDLGLPEPELASADDPALAAAPGAEVVVLLGPTGTPGTEETEPADDGLDDSAGADAGTATAPTS